MMILNLAVNQDCPLGVNGDSDYSGRRVLKRACYLGAGRIRAERAGRLPVRDAIYADAIEKKEEVRGKNAADGRGEELSPTRIPFYRQSMDFAKQLLREVLDDNVLDGAAVLAFFFLLAVFPAAIFVLSMLPSLSIPHLRQALVDLLYQVLPEQSASLFEVTVRFVAGEGKTWLSAFGLVLSLWSASSGVAAVMDQLNAIYDVKERRPFWKARGTAIVLMLFLVVLGIAALSLVIFGGVIQSWAASMIGWSAALRLLFATLRWVVLAAALLLALAVAYRFGPDAEVRFRYLSPGNVTAAVLIVLASIGFRFYVKEFGDYSATYGNLAAVIILMLWMYMAGVAVLVGGEVNRILERNRGEREKSGRRVRRGV